MVTPGLQLAFEDRRWLEISGQTLSGEQATRTVPVCGPAAYTVLKSLASADCGEPKDAFDLVYVISHTRGGGAAVADGLRALTDRPTVAGAVELLARDFHSADTIGPQRAAKFTLPQGSDQDDIDSAAADAHGHIADLLARWDEFTR